MPTTPEVRHLSVSIERPPGDVYRFASDPANLPRWASGLGASVTQVGGEWVADSPLGRVTIRFAPANPFGVLDHDVTVASGTTFHNPMRVVPNGDGSELTFTLFRQGGVPEDQFEADAATVARDLRALKSLLELKSSLETGEVAMTTYPAR